ncbi:DUF503 domain-containing protein [candidate division KSB1 bacterium]
MIVGIVSIELHIPAAGSLKEKRAVINSLKTKVGNKFNVSIAEVDYLEKWQRAALGICVVGESKGYIDSVIEKVGKFIEQDYRVMITFREIRYA